MPLFHYKALNARGEMLDGQMEAASNAEVVLRLQEQGRRLESDGWPVFSLLVADRPLGLDTSGVRVTVVEGVAALEGVLEQILKAARDARLANLLPATLRPGGVPLSDLLPAD